MENIDWQGVDKKDNITLQEVKKNGRNTLIRNIKQRGGIINLLIKTIKRIFNRFIWLKRFND